MALQRSFSKALACLAAVLLAVGANAGRVALREGLRVLEDSDAVFSSNDAAFAAWAQANNKTYSTEERDLRKAAFMASLEAVQTANSKNGGLAQFGLHPLADRTDAELEAMSLGYRPLGSHIPSKNIDDDPPPDDKPHPFDYMHIDPPPHVDWRTVPNVLGPVKSQHAHNWTCGCCWAFATTGVVESVHGLMYGEQVSVSEQQLIACDVDKMDTGCHGGDLRWGMSYIAKNGGIALEGDYPYEGRDDTCRTEVARGHHSVRITGYHDVPDRSALAFMQAVSQQPIAIGVSVGIPFLKAWHAYKGGILDSRDLCWDSRSPTCKTDHAMVLVGYGEEDGVPYWIIKNSWSADWGEAGYMRVRRDFDGPDGYGPLGMYKDAAYPVIESSWGERTRAVAEVLRKKYPNKMFPEHDTDGN